MTAFIAVAATAAEPNMWPRIGVLALLGAAGVGLAFTYAKVEPSPTFITAPVEYGSVSTLVTATGTVEARVTVDVSSQLSGQIAEVFVDFNDVVTAGQPLAQLDKESFIARVSEARAAFKMASAAARVQQAAIERARLLVTNAQTDQSLAEAIAASAKAKQDEAEREFERKTKLARTGNVSDRDLSLAHTARDTGAADLRAALVQVEMKVEAIAMAEADLRIAEANLENAQAVVEQKEATLKQAELDLNRTVIRSPIDGVILDRAVDPGQTIAVSLDARTLFTIANNLDSMEIHGRIDEADVGRIGVGQAVRFTVDAYPDRTFTGKVLQIRKASTMVQNVVTYTAIISAANEDLLLLPNMTAELSIVVAEAEETLRIPNQALRFRPDGVAQDSAKPNVPNASSIRGTVWIVGTDGRLAPITVQLGESDDNTTQLLGGTLSKGQPLVIGIAPSQVRASGIRLGF